MHTRKSLRNYFSKTYIQRKKLDAQFSFSWMYKKQLRFLVNIDMSLRIKLSPSFYSKHLSIFHFTKRGNFSDKNCITKCLEGRAKSQRTRGINKCIVCAFCIFGSRMGKSIFSQKFHFWEMCSLQFFFTKDMKKGKNLARVLFVIQNVSILN